MAVCTFTREQFESALPKDKTTGRVLWSYVGVVDGEHVYRVQAENHCFIIIRSSVHESDHSAGTGEDSIRCWLVDYNLHPVAPKVARWITRVPGWEARMTETLRYLYKLSVCLHVCRGCNKLKSAKRVGKAGPNKGRVFQSCSTKHQSAEDAARCSGSFEWLPDYFTKSTKSRTMKGAN